MPLVGSVSDRAARDLPWYRHLVANRFRGLRWTVRTLTRVERSLGSALNVTQTALLPKAMEGSIPCSKLRPQCSNSAFRTLCIALRGEETTQSGINVPSRHSYSSSKRSTARNFKRSPGKREEVNHAGYPLSLAKISLPRSRSA